MKTTKYSDLAAIAVSKNLLKEYQTQHGRTVYLNDDTEFQIKLFNPYTYSIEADICIDGKSLGDRLVLRPGQLVWLERYFDKPNKFKFCTYEVDGDVEMVQRAIAENGQIEIKFYKESTSFCSAPLINQIYKWDNDSINTTWIDNDTYCTTTKSANYDVVENPKAYACNISAAVDDSSVVGNNSLGCLAASCVDTVSFIDTYASSIDCGEPSYTKTDDSEIKSMKLKNKNIETGRVEQGGYSNQKFQNVNMDFELWPFATERIKILPVSVKQVFKEDLQKIYCPECGRKVKPKFKFCPFCGNKL